MLSHSPKRKSGHPCKDVPSLSKEIYADNKDGYNTPEVIPSDMESKVLNSYIKPTTPVAREQVNLESSVTSWQSESIKGTSQTEIRKIDGIAAYIQDENSLPLDNNINSQQQQRK